MMVKIYLSPSNQPNNAYCVGGTNEKVQMEAVAHKVKAILDAQYICETVMATLSKGIDYNERPLEARQKGCNIYLAIHSNAGSSSASGAVAFHHPSQPVGKTLATNITKELAAICPIKSNRSTTVQNGMLAFNGSGYGEIRSPYQHGLTAVLAETDFHDNPKTARWIIDNKGSIASAYVAALAATFNIMRKDTTAPVKPPIGKLYKVQVGAYSVKANANEQLVKLKKAGFDGYIKYE